METRLPRFPVGTHRMKRLIDRVYGYEGWKLFGVVALPLAVVYLLTASWSLPYHVDPMTNAITAAELAWDGDVFLEDYSVLVENSYGASAPWVVPAKDSAVSQYPPGAALLAVPLYAVWPRDVVLAPIPARGAAPSVEIAIPPLGPAAIIGALTVAVAAGLLALAFKPLVGGTLAIGAAYSLGLTSGAWSIAADALWQHGPAMMWIAAGLVLATRRPLAAGLAFGMAVLTRPHTALIAAGNGLGRAWGSRSVAPAVRIGAGAAVGLAGLIAFNQAVFGSLSISGGYSDSFAPRTASLDLLDYLGNIALALVHPERGLFVYSPFLLLLIPGIRPAWRAAPAWVRGSALGGVAYLLLQFKVNRYSGGSSFWGYRYPLEALVAGAPLLVLSYREWVEQQTPSIRRLFAVAIALSLGIAAYGAIAK